MPQVLDTDHVFGDVIPPDRESGDGKRGRHSPWLTSGTIDGATQIQVPSQTEHSLEGVSIFSAPFPTVILPTDQRGKP